MLRKSVFIIGASSGIGESCAKYFAQKGYSIIATYNNSNLDKLQEFCNNISIPLLKIKMNIQNLNEIEEGFKIAFSNNYIESVVCNAGICLPEMLLCDTPIDKINELIDTNFRGTILCNRQAMKCLMKQKFGSIINVSSIYGEFGGSCEAVYSATKAGIIGLTKALALECSSFNVRVNAVAPGFIKTPMTKEFNDEEKANIIRNTPLARLGEGEDVAKAIYFLSSDESSFITGEILNVTGGAIQFN